MRKRLQRAGFGAQETDAALTELIELGQLDDARYARLFAQDRRTLDSWGEARIARTLRERGVETHLIEDALRADSPQAELQRAVALLCSRFRGGPAGLRDRRRAAAMLMRRGYGSETASDAVREWARLQGADAEPQP